ncbi:hypothetical protein TNCV_343061 [Trichonephila clavipes]|nr:hypothetical protein TNCV_343061 [Trichonephila clavipes]
MESSKECSNTDQVILSSLDFEVRLELGTSCSVSEYFINHAKMTITAWSRLLAYIDTTATHSPASDLTNRRANDSLFVISLPFSETVLLNVYLYVILRGAQRAREQRNSSTVMRVCQQWTDEHRTTRKTGSGRWKVTCINVGLSIRQGLLHRRVVRERMLLYRIPLTANHRSLRLQWIMSTEPGKLIGTKLSFQMNHASIYGTMMVAFVLDAIPMNSAIQSALSNEIVAERPELWFGV